MAKELLRFVGMIGILTLTATGCGKDPGSGDRFVPLQNEGASYDLSLITYNILTSVDVNATLQGYAPWASRRRDVGAFLASSGADIIAVQEGTSGQIADIGLMLSHYGVVISRKTSDSVLFYKHSRFELVDEGYWPLPSNGVFQQPRIALWMKLQDRATGREVMAIGTHLDAHRAVKARSAKVLRRHLDNNVDHDGTAFLMGDFNITPEQNGFTLLNTAPFHDASAGFGARPTYPSHAPKRRFDHIFYSGPRVNVSDWRVLEPPRVTKMSDHLPVGMQVHIDERTAASKLP